MERENGEGPTMLEANEAAETLGVSVATLKRYRRRGLIGGYQYTEGGKWVFPAADIRQFKERAFRRGPDSGTSGSTGGSGKS